MRAERRLVMVHPLEPRCAECAGLLGHWGVTKLWITKYLSYVSLVVKKSVPS